MIFDLIMKNFIKNCYCKKILLAYFWVFIKKKKSKPCLLYCYYSMLEATIKVNDNVDLRLIISTQLLAIIIKLANSVTLYYSL